MENISFVLWLCLWPISFTFTRYMEEKERSITGDEKLSLNMRAFTGLIKLIVWVGVAMLLYRKV